MRKPIGITIDPAQVIARPDGTPELARDPAIYVVCDDGSVFGQLPGRREAWVEQEPIPGTEAALDKKQR